jgi:inner membrane protein
VLLWFAGGALVAVWQVFKDPAIDYRLVMAGAVAPDVVDAAFGGARLLHTLAFSVVLLCGVMLATRGRRGTRRRLLALPIGTFLHLVLDAMWARTEVFWWPAFGLDLPGDGLPSSDRPAAVLVVQ